VRTSIPLHQWLMAHPAVRSGDVDTGWLEREWQTPDDGQDGVVRAAIAATLLAEGHRTVSEASLPGGHVGSAWRLAGRTAGLR
jgi:hypothetical protein